MTKAHDLTQIGRSQDGRAVMGGAFKLYDTYGVPLWLIVQECQKRNWMIGWQEFYIDAVSAGWKHKTIMMRVGADLRDSMRIGLDDGPEDDGAAGLPLEYVTVVLDRLNMFEPLVEQFNVSNR